VHVKGPVPEIYTVRSGGVFWKSSSTHRYIAIYAAAAANLFMLRPERLHCFRICDHPLLGVVRLRGRISKCRGKWAQAERAAHQAIPDDYVERRPTLVLHRAGATDMP
jgi:hypothetical protein